MIFLLLSLLQRFELICHLEKCPDAGENPALCKPVVLFPRLNVIKLTKAAVLFLSSCSNTLQERDENTADQNITCTRKRKAEVG